MPAQHFSLLVTCHQALVSTSLWFQFHCAGVVLARTAVIGENTVVGEGTTVGDNTIIRNSVIGCGCVIGKNVVIEGSHVWNHVTIHDHARLHHAVVCDGSVVKTQATLRPGVVLSFNVSTIL